MYCSTKFNTLTKQIPQAATLLLQSVVEFKDKDLKFAEQAQADLPAEQSDISSLLTPK